MIVSGVRTPSGVYCGMLRGPEYLKRCKELGFNAIEISDGTIEFDLETRKGCVKRAVDMGFKVLTEVGKKDPNERAGTLKCGKPPLICHIFNNYNRLGGCILNKLSRL